MKTTSVDPTFRLLTAIVLVLLARDCVAQYVELTARIETVRWSRDGASHGEPWQVRCVVGTNAWQMEGLFLNGAQSTAWFEGTNLTLLHNLPKAAGDTQRLVDRTDGLDRHIQATTPSGLRWQTISMSMDGNPSRPVRQLDLLTLHGRIAWLAFCSAPCLRREGRKLYPPSDLWKELVSAPAGFTDRTAVFEDGLGLPKSVNLQATNGSPVLQYGVSGSTNVCGWEFPLEFFLAQYRPALSSLDGGQFGPGGWEIDFVAKGTVIAIGPGSKPQAPAVPRQ